MEAVISLWEIKIWFKAFMDGYEEAIKKAQEEGLELAQGENSKTALEIQEESRHQIYSIANKIKLRGFEISLISDITGLSEEGVRGIDPKS